jgi:heptosyltransferase-2
MSTKAVARRAGPRADRDVTRLVVRAPNWLGDAVLALPAMAAVRRHFPTAHLTVAAPPGVAGVLREDTDLSPNLVLELADTRGAIAALEGGGYELGVLFPNSFRSAWQFWRAGIPARWGYGTAGRGMLLTRRSGRVDPPPGPHHADYYRALVRGLGIACDDTAPRVAVSGPSRERAQALLAQYGVSPDTALVGLAPGAAYGQAKQWPTDRVASLIARLVRERNATCLIVGASHDRSAGREIESWLRANAPETATRAIDLVGRTSLGALAGVVARCRVFVSNDSGAMHLAAALGRPVVALFGPTDEAATRPIGSHDVITVPVFCRPCLLRDCPIDHRCMKRITVDVVLAAVARHLAAVPVA